MLSSTRGTAMQFMSSLFTKPKKFKIEVVSRAEDCKQIAEILKEGGDSSDHLPMSHPTAVSLTWNTLKQCHTKVDAISEKVRKTNNGFKRQEDAATYKNRLEHNLTHVASLAKANNSDLSNAPISVICLQEITPNVLTNEQMDHILSQYNFSIRCSAATARQKAQYLVQKSTEKQNELLAMAYDPAKVEFVEVCEIPAHISKIQLHENRFQAVKFFDKSIRQPFVVVNVHQNWHAVNPAHAGDTKTPEAANDIALLLEHFYKMGMACIITGDFNTSQIKLSVEAGKMIIGKNANMYWDIEHETYHLDSCDHIIMNEKYCREFLPALQNKLTPTAADTNRVFAVPCCSKTLGQA